MANANDQFMMFAPELITVIGVPINVSKIRPAMKRRIRPVFKPFGN